MVEKNMVFKNPNWKETDQLAIYKKCSQGVALGATEDKINAVRIRMEGLNSGRPDY